jgi:hypothetical protein
MLNVYFHLEMAENNDKKRSASWPESNHFRPGTKKP